MTEQDEPTGQQVMDQAMRQMRPLLDFRELLRGQRVRVIQDPIEGVVVNPNGPVISVEREDGGSFLFEPLSSAKIEPIDESRVQVQATVALTIKGGWDGNSEIEFASPWVVDTAQHVLEGADPEDKKSLFTLQTSDVQGRADFISRCNALWDGLVVTARLHGVEIPDGAHVEDEGPTHEQIDISRMKQGLHPIYTRDDFTVDHSSGAIYTWRITHKDGWVTSQYAITKAWQEMAIIMEKSGGRDA